MDNLMTQMIKSLMLCSALWLAGCGSQNDVAPQEDAMSIDQTPPNKTPPNKAPLTKAAVNSDSLIRAGALAGQYRKAGENRPIVLIVPGSGPTNLNGNNPMGITAQPYRLLAEALSEAGVSTVRVDKRGLYSSTAAGDGNAVTVEIYAQDYRDWVTAIQAQTGADCVYMLGHSEGALMVSAAAIDNPNVCGVILLSAAGRGFGDILRAQLAANPANAPLMDDAMTAISTLEAGETVDVSDFHPALKGLFNPDVQNFMISLLATDPAATAGKITAPVLIIQGDRDLQTTPEDAQKLATAAGVRPVIIAGMNHVLKNVPDNPAQNLASYSNPDLPINIELVERITDFVK